MILNQENMKQELKDLEFNFIELPKFNITQQEELKTIIEKWVYFLKNAENLQIVPKDIKDEWLKEAYEVVNQFLWSEKELEVYDYWILKDMDKRAEKDYAVEEWIREWMEKWMEKWINKWRKEWMEFKEKQLIENLMKKMKISEDEAKEILLV